MRWNIAKACVFGLLFFVVSLAIADDKLAAKLVIDNPDYNFGTVSAGKKVENSFFVKNISDQPIEISDIRPDCGCTSSVVDTKTIEKGKEAKVEVVFNTTGFSGFKSKVVRVYVNDPLIGYFLLRVEGNVVSDFTVDPGRVYFNEVFKGKDSPEQLVSIVSNIEQPVKLREIVVDNAAIKSEIITAEGKQLTAKISLLQPLPVGVLRANVKAVIVVGDKEVRVIAIPLVAMVKADYQINPTEISFGLIRKEDLSAQEGLVTINFRNPIDPKTVEVKTSQDYIVAEIAEARENAVTLRIKLTDAADGNIRGSAIVELGSKKERESVVVPVYAIIGRQGE